MQSVILHNPVDEIHKCLLKQQSNVFVLIDVNSNPALRGELFNQSDAPVFHCLYHGTILQELRDRAPYLLQIELHQYQYLHYLFEQAAEHFLLIFSDHDIDTLYQHWQSLLTVRALDGDIALYKLYTAQILGPFLKACKPYEQARLLAFCDELYLFNDCREWELCYQADPALSVPLSELKHVHPELKTAWWHLQPHQLDYLTFLTERALVKNMGNHLADHHMEALLPYKDQTLSQLVRHGIQRARFYGLETRTDLSFFLGLMFELAADFDEHPKIHSWLLNKAPETSVLELVDQIPDSVWDSLHNDPDSPAWQQMPKPHDRERTRI